MVTGSAARTPGDGASKNRVPVSSTNNCLRMCFPPLRSPIREKHSDGALRTEITQYTPINGHPYPAIAYLRPPERLEPIWRKLGVSHRVLNVSVAEVSLQRSRIMTIIGQLETAGMPEHVRVDLDAETSHGSGPLDHPSEPRRRKR